MNNFQTKQAFRRQAGLTLIEAVAFLAIFGMVIMGALSLFGSASSSERSTSFVSQITAIRAATQQMWNGQGTYGTGTAGNINNTLNTAKRIPTSLKVDTTTNPVTITNQDNGTITITGNGSSFTVTSTNHPADVCTAAVSTLSGQSWSAISVNGAAQSLPVSPSTAATACSLAANTVLLTSN